MAKGRIRPGKLEANAIIPSPAVQVKTFMNIDSPLNARPKALPIPPVMEVSIAMLGVIQLMAPFSVSICSPCPSVQITTGRLSP